jgi:NTP pyrophosphatase (non-canonical NTP hydrolase)
MNLTDLSKQIYEANREKGFWDNERNIGEALMLVVTELSEGLEAHRKGIFAPKQRLPMDKFEAEIKDTFEDEIADSIIRLLDLAGGLGIDIDYHVMAKLEYNKTRARLHGKNY